MRSSIAVKLALLLALVGALAAGLTGFYAFEASGGLLVESAKNKLLTSTQVLARRIVLTREEISRNLRVLTSHPAALAVLRHGDPEMGEQLATLFRLVMEANPAFSQIRLISADDFGLERVRMDRSNSVPIEVKGDDLQEKAHYAYVAETLKLPAGATYLSRITINHESGSLSGLDQPAFQLAMPVMGEQGAALGVVVINVDLNGMFALLAADLPRTFELFLANGEGDVLIHPDRSQTFGFDKGRRVLIQDQFPPTIALVEGSRDDVVFEAPGPAGTDAPRVAAFIGRRLAVPSDESRMILGLAQPVTDVLAQSRSLGTTILQIVSGLCLACLLAAVLLARAFTRPIDAVSLAARRLAEGLPPGPLPVERHDEIGALAHSFQRMQEQITQQVADLQATHAELAHLARHDTLTGLPNRRLFHERLEQALAHARRYGERLGVLFIDLDDFKAINDRLGHEAGDIVLKAVADRLTSAIRGVDTVARLGGDEFVVLLTAVSQKSHLMAITQELLRGLSLPISVQGTALTIGASVGISRYPEDGADAEEIMAHADQAMYEVKAGGPGGFRFHATRH